MTRVGEEGVPNDPITTESAPAPTAQIREELERVLGSPAFERSERLQRFLRYICELTLNNEAHRINEYLIGSEVFRKGSNYNPNEDSIVRRQAHTLRQKLQEYYAGEGQDHAVRIELPLGRYVPVFRRPEAQKPARVSEEPPPVFQRVEAMPGPAKPGKTLLGAGALLMSIAGAAFTLLVHPSTLR